MRYFETPADVRENREIVHADGNRQRTLCTEAGDYPCRCGRGAGDVSTMNDADSIRVWVAVSRHRSQGEPVRADRHRDTVDKGG